MSTGWTLDREIGLALVILGGGFFTICALLVVADAALVVTRALRRRSVGDCRTQQ